MRITVQQSNDPGPDYFLMPVYDHILVSPQTSPALPHDPVTRGAGHLGIVGFDQSDYWHGHTWNELIRAMSDHRPVWCRADHNAADLD